MGKKDVLLFFKHSLMGITAIATLAGGFMGLAYLRDPLHLFHAPKSEDIFWKGQMRILAAGFIRNYSFDSAIVGTSVLQNSSSAEMGLALGGRFMNLSAAGSPYDERSVILGFMLKQKPMKNVVFSLDRYYLDRDVKGYPRRFWGFLYDDDRLNDMKVYTDARYLKSILFGLSKDGSRTLDRPMEWGTDEYNRCRLGGVQNWVSNQDKGGIGNFFRDELPAVAAKADPALPLVRNEERTAQARGYVESNVFRHVQEHPEAQFFFVFPPYWRYWFASLRQSDAESFALHQDIVRYAVRRAAELGNAKVFGLEDCAFVDDIANYRDMSHYSEEINSYIAESMGQGRHLLTPDSVEAYLARCEELARAFDIKALNAEVQRLMAR